MEQYKLLNGETKKYISNFGNYKQTFKKGDRISTGSNNKDGYKYMVINKKTNYIHRLVLQYFGSQCPEGFECDHIDNIRSNNHIDNLRWVSKSDNCKNRRRYIKSSKSGTITKRKDGRNKPYQFRFQLNFVSKTKSFKTIQEALIAQAIYKGSVNILELYN